MQQAYISIGANLESPIYTVQKALKKISELYGILGFRCSNLYETDPISKIPQNPFINAVCTFLTGMKPEELLEKLQQIEKELGKVPKGKEEPRQIDLDLLFLGNEVRDDPNLMLPHPEWNQRLFVLRPLLDLTEEIQLSKTINIRELVVSFTPSNKVRLI